MKVVGETNYSLLGKAGKGFTAKRRAAYKKQDIAKICQACGCEYKTSEKQCKKYRNASVMCYPCRVAHHAEGAEELAAAKKSLGSGDGKNPS